MSAALKFFSFFWDGNGIRPVNRKTKKKKREKISMENCMFRRVFIFFVQIPSHFVCLFSFLFTKMREESSFFFSVSTRKTNVKQSTGLKSNNNNKTIEET